MGFTYVLLGAGRQNVAAAYDLARFGDANRLVMTDVSGSTATASADRVNRLVGRSVATAVTLDIRDHDAVRHVLETADGCVSGIHYGVNLDVSRMAIETRTHMTDFGGNTDIVRQQLALDAEARRAGIAIVPDCGMGPGLNISLAIYSMSLVETPREVRIWDGGLPQQPEEPWNYVSTFALPGLTNEFAGHATYLRNGEITPVPCLTEIDELDFPEPIGRLEGFVTSGGLSTAPWTLHGTLTCLENKTLRYPGHIAKLQAFADLGLLDTDPIEVAGSRIVPRDVFHALLEPRIVRTHVKDVCVMRVSCIGATGGRPAEAIVELIDSYDEATGFTAMQRLTGWHASIMLIEAVHGRIPAGATAVERAMSGQDVVRESRRRGLAITERVTVA